MLPGSYKQRLENSDINLEPAPSFPLGDQYEFVKESILALFCTDQKSL